jgi:hypothetical protein
MRLGVVSTQRRGPVLGYRAGLEVRLNVAGVQVGDGHQEPRA